MILAGAVSAYHVRSGRGPCVSLPGHLTNAPILGPQEARVRAGPEEDESRTLLRWAISWYGVPYEIELLVTTASFLVTDH